MISRARSAWSARTFSVSRAWPALAAPRSITARDPSTAAYISPGSTLSPGAQPLPQQRHVAFGPPVRRAQLRDGILDAAPPQTHQGQIGSLPVVEHRRDLGCHIYHPTG